MTSGVVISIPERNWQGKTFYSVELNNGKSYGTGAYKPRVNVGDAVEFEEKENARGYLDVVPKTLRVVQGYVDNQVHSNASAASTVQKGRAVGFSKDDYFRAKDDRDLVNDELRRIGASRNTAMDWVKFLVTQGAFKLPTKVAEQEEVLNKLLDDYTVKFMSDEAPTVPEPVETKAAKPASKPRKQVEVAVDPVRQALDDADKVDDGWT